MPIYQVTPIANNAEQVRTALEKNIGESDIFEIPNNTGWFVSFPGTTIELSNKIEVTGQAPGIPNQMGSTLITHIVAYYGRAGADMWEWLKNRFERQ